MFDSGCCFHDGCQSSISRLLSDSIPCVVPLLIPAFSGCLFAFRNHAGEEQRYASGISQCDERLATNGKAGVTKKIICIRTHLGIKSQKIISKIQKNQILPYNVNQFSFDIIENKLKKFNFKSFFILDKSTNNSSKFKLINNTHKKYTYIVLGVKNKLPNHQ